MADEIDAAIDKLHAAGATDAEITSIIREKFGKPFDVMAQNATMRANMAKQDVAANRQPESEFTLSKMAGRAGAGVKGELEGAAAGLGGLAALPVAAYTAIRHPVATAKGLGTGVMLAGRMIGQAAENPGETLSAATDAATRFGTDPEKIGMAAGGLDVALATPAMIRGIQGTRIGQAVGTGLSSAVDRVPGVKEARSAWEASGPTPARTMTPIPEGIGSSKAGPTPLELTRMLKAENAAKYANPLADFKPSDVNIQLNDASKMSPESLGTLNRFMATPTTEAPLDLAKLRSDAIGKPSFTSREVLKIKMLIQQGLSQDKAIELVKSAVQ